MMHSVFAGAISSGGFFLQASSRDWFITGMALLALVVLLAVAEGIRQRMGWPAEATRKLVHVLTGVLVIYLLLTLTNPAPLLLLSLLFVVVNFLALRSHLLPALHSARANLGTVFYPLSVAILLLLGWPNHRLAILLGVSLLAFGDALAAMVGNAFPRARRYNFFGDNKSLPGMLTMFLSSWIICFFLLQRSDFAPQGLAPEWAALLALGIALVATLAEALSKHGSDNLSVPLLSGLLLPYLLRDPVGHTQSLLLAALLGALIVILSLRLGFLNPGGAMAALLLAIVIFGVGGWRWAIPILAFFLLSSVLSSMNSRAHSSVLSQFEKGSRRDAAQVLANGGLAALLVLLEGLWQGEGIALLYLAVIAAATADTWATEIGIHSPQPPRLITTLSPVHPGTSGGISLLGLLGAAAGASIIALIGWLLPLQASANPAGLSIPAALLVAVSGMLASLVDSFLGATVQAHFRCPTCGRISEKQNHCPGEPARLARGLAWMNNDMVNFTATAFALIFALFFLILGRWQ